MIRFRVSIAAFMAGIAYFGVAFAALRNPTRLWSEAWLTMTLTGLTLALLAAIYRNGGSRTFWGGFAIVGWGFMALNIFPADPPHLVTRGPIEWSYRTLSYDPTSAERLVWVSMDGEYREARLDKASQGNPQGRYRVSINDRRSVDKVVTGAFPASALRPVSPDGYQLLCHTILAPLLSLLGGLAACICAGRRSYLGEQPLSRFS